MPLESTDHSIEGADERGTIRLSARLSSGSSDRLKIVASEKLIDIIANNFTRRMLIVVELEGIDEVVFETRRQGDSTALSVEFESVAHGPVTEGAHTVLACAHSAVEGAHHLFQYKSESGAALIKDSIFTYFVDGLTKRHSLRGLLLGDASLLCGRCVDRHSRIDDGALLLHDLELLNCADAPVEGDHARDRC